MKQREMRKSNLDFNRFSIFGVKNIYAMETQHRKDIHISKSYCQHKDGTIQWNGQYEIEYDGVTDLYCYIDIKNGNPKIEFVCGDSIHGSSEVYELDKEYNCDIIESIIDKVEKNKRFKNFCSAKDYYNHMDASTKKELCDEYGSEAEKGYILSEVDYDLLTVQRIDEVDIIGSDLTAVDLAYDNNILVIDRNLPSIRIGNQYISGEKIERILDDMIGSYKHQVVYNEDNIEKIRKYMMERDMIDLTTVKDESVIEKE